MIVLKLYFTTLKSEIGERYKILFKHVVAIPLLAIELKATHKNITTNDLF